MRRQEQQIERLVDKELTRRRENRAEIPSRERPVPSESDEIPFWPRGLTPLSAPRS